MIKFIDIPTEQTTAATDFILFIQTVVFSCILYSMPSLHVFKGYLWIGIMASIGLTALLGTIAHGFQMKEKTNTVLWQILTLSFSIVYVLILTAVSFDILGFNASLITLGITILLGIILTGVCIKFPSFVPKIIFIGVGLGILMLGSYFYLWLAIKMPGAGFMLMGIVLSFAAVIIEARQKFYIKLIWEFDHHSAYHFFQFFSNLALFYGTLIYFK